MNYFQALLVAQKYRVQQMEVQKPDLVQVTMYRVQDQVLSNRKALIHLPLLLGT